MNSSNYKKPSEINIPIVSVVMSVFNGQKHLSKSIDSILQQTYTNFEFIIIDDGSTDASLDIIKSYKDSRISLLARENKGLVYSLNEGIKMSKGAYIARQDADDISCLDRLEKEVDTLERTGAVLVSTAFSMFDKDPNKPIDLQCLINNDKILKREMIVQNPFAHGATMFIKDMALRAGLYVDIGPAEDYDLWVKLMSFGKFAYVEDIGYMYRINPEGISQKQYILQANVFRGINKRLKTKDIPPIGSIDIEQIIDQISQLPHYLKDCAIDRITSDQKVILGKNLKEFNVKRAAKDLYLLSKLTRLSRKGLK